jgi:hypothetical protein
MRQTNVIIAERKKIAKSWKGWKRFLKDCYVHIMIQEKYIGTKTDAMVFN